MPRLVKIEGETIPSSSPEKADRNGVSKRTNNPAASKRGNPTTSRRGNPLGGISFRDDTIAAPADEQAKFLHKLLERYPDAAQPRIDESLASLVVPVDDLVPDSDNAVLHPEPNMRAIMESFAAFGQRKPVVVRAENMRVMAGNGSLEAVKRLGWPVIAAAVQSMTDAEAAAYGLADNRTSDLHKWDKQKVKLLDALIRESNVKVVGWTSGELRVIRMHIPPKSAPRLLGMVYKIIIECKSEEHQVELLTEFEQRCIKCQALIS